MALNSRYHFPTHQGMLVNSSTGQRVSIKLTRTKNYWASPAGSLFKVATGNPKGTPGIAIWALDLTSITEIQQHAVRKTT